MKNKKINLSDLLALIFIIAIIFIPFVDFEYKNYFEQAYKIYFYAYFGFLFLNIKKGKPLLLLFPLVIYSLLIFLLFNGVSFFNNKEVIKDFLMVFYNDFSLIVFALSFFLIERFFTKIFGRYFTSFIAFLSLILYLTMYFTNLLENYDGYKDYFLYLFAFLTFSQVYAKANVKIYLYIIVFLLIVGEIFVIYKYKVNFSFLITPLLFMYILFKREKNVDRPYFERYFLFAIIFIYPIIKYLMAYYLLMRLLPLFIASLLITFFISVIIYEIKSKLLSVFLLGIY